LNQKKIVLSDQQLKLVRSIVRGESIGNAVNQPWDQERNPEDDKKGVLNWEIPKVIGKLNNAPEPKRRFMPSKVERNIVNKLVYAINRGWLDVNQKKKEWEEQGKRINKDFNEEEFMQSMGQLGDVWMHQEDEKLRLDPLIAPHFDLPDHIESFNPPMEFIENPSECNNSLLLYIIYR
jgi:ribosome biogenesis protein ERB1